MINRTFFFDYLRANLFGKLTQSQVAGMIAILDQWEAQGLKDDRQLAYMLATAYHETDKTMQPIEEYGKGKGKPYGKPDSRTGRTYYGRGLAQITWYANYNKMGQLLGIDLVNNPYLALQIDTATKILFAGLIEGLFTGKKLSDYFNAEKEDWKNARRTVNGLDKADLIAGYALKFYASLSHK